ncbi:uncharacterized protein LOC124161141 isoform X2 [Ischnura elegans]|uniref:uncharacterized protein LOC124161141 isoform X2 n=1 Tax=Ischnura elegans TaxID=197161 RepID=UPI001ED8AFA9|nr:uncharacterized protein LOC124161141 isoform X2 [Ischnura elegans]
MKVEVISLVLIASLAVAAALPVGSSEHSSQEREERARKGTAKLRSEEDGEESAVEESTEEPQLSTEKPQDIGDDSVIVTARPGASAAEDDEALLPAPEDGVIRPIPNASVLVLMPKAHAKAGVGGRAVARPLSLAFLRRKEDRVIYLPEVSAVAGPGGTAIALPELIIKRLWEKEEGDSRLEHRGAEGLDHIIRKAAGDGEVVEASEVVSANAGEKSVAQAQPIGIATAGLGGVAVSKPQGVAVVGPGGLAIARPIAVAVAGPGADKPGIFLNPEGGQGSQDGDQAGQTEETPEVEEASEEGESSKPETPAPPVVFHYMLYPQAMFAPPPSFYQGLV